MIVIFILTINSNFIFALAILIYLNVRCDLFFTFKAYKLCAKGLSKLVSMERFVTRIDVENKMYYPALKYMHLLRKLPNGLLSDFTSNLQSGG